MKWWPRPWESGYGFYLKNIRWEIQRLHVKYLFIRCIFVTLLSPEDYYLMVFANLQNSRGQEFTVVLLDSEGIDAADSESRDDNQIFTLTVLLASVLIYNSQGVPTRRDVEGLEYPFYIANIT